jgi:hypothetical protein
VLPSQNPAKAIHRAGKSACGLWFENVFLFLGWWGLPNQTWLRGFLTSAQGQPGKSPRLLEKKEGLSPKQVVSRLCGHEVVGTNRDAPLAACTDS